MIVSQSMRQTINELLVQLDGFSDQDVIVIAGSDRVGKRVQMLGADGCWEVANALVSNGCPLLFAATNVPDALDPALVRY